MSRLLLSICCFLFINCYSQKKDTSFFLETGWYAPGIKPGTTQNGSFWYIQADSSFINFYISAGVIKSIQKGRWNYLGDSMVSLKYQPLKTKLLLRSKISYHSETKNSLDSNYVFGTVTNKENKPLFCSIAFENGEFEQTGFLNKGTTGGMTDKKGNFSYIISKRNSFTHLTIMNGVENYYPLSIQLNPNHNYHTFKIVLPLRDSTNDIDLKYPIDPVIQKYRPNIERKKRNYVEGELGITFISKDKTLLLTILKDARKKQPYLVGPIDELIDFLENKN